jgi:hypothetical protein
MRKSEEEEDDSSNNSNNNRRQTEINNLTLNEWIFSFAFK